MVIRGTNEQGRHAVLWGYSCTALNKTAVVIPGWVTAAREVELPTLCGPDTTQLTYVLK